MALYSITRNKGILNTMLQEIKALYTVLQEMKALVLQKMKAL